MVPTNDAWSGNGYATQLFYNGSVINFADDAESNFPMCRLAPGCGKFDAFCCSFTGTASLTPVLTTSSLTEPQCHVLQYHHCFGHVGFH